STLPQPRPRQNIPTSEAIPAVERGASTIDALFSPIEIVETIGLVWFLKDDALTPISVRLGATDGTTSELIEGQTTERTLIDGSLLVTNVTTSATPNGRATGGATSPLIPQFPFGRRRSSNSTGNPR
ncbi:MAG: hypothetical protein VX262_06570, partial [Acidobacteriota bacterium]|nr:hypothetical protein [Acidobacteriota bacterium]